LKLAAWVTGPILLGLVIALAQQSLASPSALGRQNLQALLLQGPALMAATQNIIAVSETYWNRYSKRQEELERTLAKSLVTPQLDLAAHCDKSAIVLHHGGVAQTLEAGWSNLVEQALAGQPGRCTFTADNGAGKSMALLQLTEILGPDRSFLLPADHQDLSFNIPKGSTGQRDVAAIEAALSSGAQVVLLDEWDAHLDDANRAMLSDRIDHLTRPKAEGGMGLLVVEISHRHKESG
jgi:hypothetical protein